MKKFTGEEFRRLADRWEKAGSVFVDADIILAALRIAAARPSAQTVHTMINCAHCGAPFKVGAGTGRRITAMYCSNKHRVAAQRRSEAFRQAT